MEFWGNTKDASDIGAGVATIIGVGAGVGVGLGVGDGIGASVPLTIIIDVEVDSTIDVVTIEGARAEGARADPEYDVIRIMMVNDP